MPELKETQIHRTRLLGLPGGGAVQVDLVMVPVVRVLWQLGLQTRGCCQDLGESIASNGHGSSAPAAARQRHADFYSGQAWLQMPVDDALRLVSLIDTDPAFAARLRRRTHPQAWSTAVVIEPRAGEPAALSRLANLYFPRAQLPELIQTLTAQVQP